MNAADVISLYTDLESMGTSVWVDGGWGVDALLGEQTRPHKDLDIAIQQKDVYGPPENNEMYPAASLTGTGSILGQVVRCISPEWMVKFHSGYKLKEKDFRDVSALCKRFGIELPESFAQFKTSG